MAQTDPVTVIDLFFEHTLFQVPWRRMRRDCLLVSAAMELTAHLAHGFMTVNHGLRVASFNNVSKKEIGSVMDTTPALPRMAVVRHPETLNLEE